jgi:hypothetical protein
MKSEAKKGKPWKWSQWLRRMRASMGVGVCHEVSAEKAGSRAPIEDDSGAGVQDDFDAGCVTSEFVG